MATGAPLPLPPILDTSSVVTFVGRTPELNQLAACWARAQTGQRQLVLVSGEPGIGKTRLSLTFARTCADAGGTVLVGRSDEEALVRYQPFVEALTWYTSVCPDDELRDDLAAFRQRLGARPPRAGSVAPSARPADRAADEC